jgi:hypothetical protein
MVQTHGEADCMPHLDFSFQSEIYFFEPENAVETPKPT